MQRTCKAPIRAILAFAAVAVSGLAVAAPTPGPTSVRVSTHGLLANAAVVPLGTLTTADAQPGEEYVFTKDVLGNHGGADSVAFAVSYLRGTPFAASVTAPNEFPQQTSPFVGGIAEVEINKTFRKETDARLLFTYTDLAFQLGWEKEFGIKCPVGDEGCQFAGWDFVVDVWRVGNNTPVWTDHFYVEVESRGDAQNKLGYDIHRDGSSVGYRLIGTAGQYGVDLSIFPNFSIEADLSGIAVDEVFVVSSWLRLTAYDRGGHLAPGRIVMARAWDPLTLAGGPRIEAVNLTPWEAIPQAAPEPTTLALAVVGLLLGSGVARRRRQNRSPCPRGLALGAQPGR